jgi:hypothetical protein
MSFAISCNTICNGWDNLQLQVQLDTKIHKAMDGKIQNFIWDAIVIDANNPIIELFINIKRVEPYDFNIQKLYMI